MKLESNWRCKSLLNLKMIHIANPDGAPTQLIKQVYQLIDHPLNEYTVENLRLMIGQEIGLLYLIPLAIEKLSDNLFAEGDMYEGDLLSNVVNIDPVFWEQNPDLKEQVNYLIENRRHEIDLRQISLKKFCSQS